MTTPSGMGKPLPNRFLRGLRDKDFIVRDQDGDFLSVSERAYEPNVKTRGSRKAKGESDHYESSINWEDQPIKTFQILSENQNAAYGIVSLCLEDLKTAKAANPLAAKFLDWERAEEQDNSYHGNLLFSGNLPKPKFRQLAAVIATHVDGNLILVEPQNYETELAARTATAQFKVTNKPEHLDFWHRVLSRIRAMFKQ